MRDWDTEDERPGSSGLIRTAMVMFLAVTVILGVVLYQNREKRPSNSGSEIPTQEAGRWEDTPVGGNRNASNAAQGNSATDDTGLTTQGNGRTSDEMDFWNSEYQVEAETPTPTRAPENDITTDGNHTMITYRDGSTEWLTISPRIRRNNYENANFVYQTPIMKYYRDGARCSYMGVMVSEEQDYVDYIKLKNAGVEFVMIRIGYTDAETGEIIADTQFSQNMKNSTDAELSVGVYYVSHAKNEEEALAEAQFVLDGLAEYEGEVNYPIACILEASVGGEGRADGLTKTDRTRYARLFMNTVRTAGFGAVLGANKECLILKTDLTALEQEDIWLLQPGDIPDYPYFFSMWQYDGDGTIDGIAGSAQLIIAMKDLSVR